MHRVPAEVYEAARRVYVGTAVDDAADDAAMRAWALRRWAGRALPEPPHDLARWIMSQASQDGHQ